MIHVIEENSIQASYQGQALLREIAKCTKHHWTVCVKWEYFNKSLLKERFAEFSSEWYWESALEILEGKYFSGVIEHNNLHLIYCISIF